MRNLVPFVSRHTFIVDYLLILIQDIENCKDKL